MKNRTYMPQPIDTSNVEVPRYLLDLADTLARNVHDIWAQERIRQGWQYGPERDDDKKLHPCLLPYDDLPDSEKVYDCNTVLETIKVLLGLGYKIKKK